MSDVFGALRRLILKLLGESPFYGHVLACTIKEVSTEIPFAAGMRVTKDKLVIIVNPQPFFEYSATEQLWVLLHELLHFLFKHPWRGSAMSSKLPENPTEWTTMHLRLFVENVGFDLAINSFAKTHVQYSSPKGALSPDMFGFPEHKTAEWYIHHLTKAGKCPKHGISLLGGGKGQGECGCEHPKAGKALKDLVGSYFGHEWTIECEPSQANALAARIFANAVKIVGTEPAGALRDVYKVEAVADFRNVLMRLAQSSELTDEQYFHKRRISRRFHRPPGSRYEPAGELHVLQDTSGSMGPEDIGACYSVINKLYRMGFSIWVYEFDAAFQGPEYLYRGTPPQVKGGGGTKMMSTLEHVHKTRPNIKQVVVFTDAGIFDIPEEIPFGFKSVVFCIPDWVDDALPDWITVVKYKSAR